MSARRQSTTGSPGSARARLLAAGRALRGDGRGWTLLAVAVGWLLILGVRFALPTLLPRIRATFAIDNATAGVAVTVVWMSYGLLQFPAGALVDRLGTRRLLASSMALSAGGVALLGVAPTFGPFLVAAATFGVGTGLYGPARGIVLSATYPDNDGAAFGATLAAGSVGAAAVPLAAGVLAADLGWRLTLGLAVPAFALSAVALGRTVPAASERDRGTGAGTGDGPSGLARDGLRAVVAATTGRAVVVPVVAVTLMLFAFQGLTAFLPTYLVDAKGLSDGAAAGVFALLFVAGAAFQLLGGTAADRFGDRRVLVAVSVASALPVAAIPFVDGVVGLAVVVAAVGLRLGAIPVTNAYVVAALPDGVQGTAWGLLRTLLFVVGATGSTVVGVFADAGLFDEAFLGMAGVTVLAGFAYALLPERDG